MIDRRWGMAHQFPEVGDVFIFIVCIDGVLQ